MKKPYVILIGSASGIGKSTAAAELAKDLNIKHLVESDFIRAVVRGIIGKEYAPPLHESSYTAYKLLRNKDKYDDYDELVSAGFEEHASFVIPALEKVINRAITDYDDIILEGVHLVPGLINVEQFKNRASVYFFVLASDEESHKSRFVKRAIQIHRGGKQLDFFIENRIIHNHLIKQAKKYDIPVVQTQTIEDTLKKIQRIINKCCKTILLKNSIDELKDVIDIIIKENSGSMEEITYEIEGFRNPLVRKISISEYDEANRFIYSLEKYPEKKKELQKLYDLSEFRKTKICAPNNEVITKIISDLDRKGYLYKK